MSKIIDRPQFIIYNIQLDECLCWDGERNLEWKKKSNNYYVIGYIDAIEGMKEYKETGKYAESTMDGREIIDYARLSMNRGVVMIVPLLGRLRDNCVDDDNTLMSSLDFVHGFKL